MSKFQEFLNEHKIDPRRLLVASRQVERLTRQDRRALSLAAAAKGSAEGKKERPKLERSGRPVTPRLLDQATAGKPVSGPAKTRLLRAVNRVLEQKKGDPVDLRRLF